MKIHIVQKGDTLWKIAQKYGVNFEELKKMNTQLSNPDMIMPGMKIKVPTSGGSIKKEGPVHLGVKKEAPIKEMPKKEAPIKEMPVKEVPIKEQPIIKEVPKAPYTPKMPLQVAPEIEIDKYYITKMQKMEVKKEQPKMPILPAKEIPKKEIPIKEVPIKEMPIKEMPIKEMPMKEVPIKANPIPAPLPIQANPIPAPIPTPVEMPVQEYCVPVTPVMPGPGFCPPFGGFPVMPAMPYQPGMAMPMGAGMAPGMAPGYTPGMVAGASAAMPPVGGYMPQHFGDESSSFMPQMPVMGAGNPGAMMGTTFNPGYQQPMTMDPAGYAQMPGAYGQMPAGQMPGAYGAPMGYEQMPAGQYPAGYGQFPQGQYPAGYGQMPMGYGQMPMGYDQMSMGYGQTPMGYNQMPMGYGQTPGFPQGQAELGANPAGMPMQGGYPTGMGYGPSMPSGPDGTMGNPQMGSPYGTGTRTPYGATPYGYPQMAGAPGAFPSYEVESSPAMMQAGSTQQQSLPVGTGSLEDCGCGATAQAPVPEQPTFVPPTPPIYSAPYKAPLNVAQPPFMNPYGIGPVGTDSFGTQGYSDESS
ncbi:SafA/ExsA family spore coat assembly protein [Neobacillus niacini]|uniref:SafA/ExsA family spore coat assembly protein n=1 Tax=Neobacillus niacini TaxID=86668 RepID=UPI0021CB8CAF|nr:SafA/ExsA family spore coat assembly protein [Neobacillus niacini]MCM3765426.1 SafA/ExsA family spore coat assembly protein [Neobacillus niacini]